MNYLTGGWPLQQTSTVYMSGKSVFNVRRYGKPGIITVVELFPADAQLIRDAINERVNEAEAEALREAADAMHAAGSGPDHAQAPDQWLRNRADAIEKGVDR